jgi:LysM repeat protein
VTTISTASVGGFASDPVTTTVTFAALPTLQLTKTASPLTYNQVGQSITFTFVIQNISAAAIGPTQFTITDNRLGAPINCGAATTLAPQQTISCSGTYIITQNDLSASSIVNSATASGGGTNVSAPATTTVTLSSTPPGLSRGATIQHRVVKGEWMIQIARCYGASFIAMRSANRQIADPDVIDPDILLTVPNIGSNGTIYGPPCVGFHTVQSGETWSSIAQRYNADPAVLQAANRKGMAVGTVLKIPLNSAGSTSSIPVSGPTPTLTPTLTFNPTPTFTPSPPSTQTSQATRITFPVGSNSTMLNGSVPADGTIRYVLTANLGQTLSVTATVPTNEVAVTLTDPNGVALNPLAATLTWNLPIMVSGDYTIQIDDIAGISSKPYTLNVSLTTP